MRETKFALRCFKQLLAAIEEIIALSNTGKSPNLMGEYASTMQGLDLSVPAKRLKPAKERIIVC